MSSGRWAAVIVLVALVAGGILLALSAGTRTDAARNLSQAESTVENRQRAGLDADLSSDAPDLDAGETPQPPARLSGRVLENGAGVAQAEVTATRRGAAGAADCSDSATTRTTAGGELALERLCAGLYDVLAVRGPLVASAVIRLDAGEDAPLTLTLSASARLLLSAQLTSGEPLPGVRVSVQLRSSGFAQHAVTDATGLATLGPLPVGFVDLHAESDRALAPSLEKRMLAPGDNRVQAIFRPAELVSGVVVAPNGEPIPELTVRLFRATKDGGRGQREDATQTVDGGFFRFGPLAAGPRWVATEDRAWGEAQAKVAVPGPPVRLQLMRGTTVEVEVLDVGGAEPFSCAGGLLGEEGRSSWFGCDAGVWVAPNLPRGRATLVSKVMRADAGMGVTTTELEVPPNTERLRVTMEIPGHTGRISGRCVRADGGVFEGAETVIAASATNFRTLLWNKDFKAMLAGSFGGARCAPDFVIDGLQPGEYALSCSEQSMVTAKTGDTGVQAICDDAEAPRLRFRLLDERGHAVEEFGFQAGRFSRYPDGVYENAGEPGPTALSIHTRTHPAITRRVELPLHGVVDLGELRLSPPEEVSGRVTDAATGAPISGARVGIGIDWTNARYVAITGADGRFLVRDAPARASPLVVSREGYQPFRETLGAQLSQLEISLTPAVVLRGSVITRDGTLPPGASVRASNEVASFACAADDGRYAFDDLPPGVWSLRLEADDGAETSGFAPLKVAAQTPGTYTRDLIEGLGGVSFSVQVLDPRGVPLVVDVFAVDARTPVPRTRAERERSNQRDGVRADGVRNPYRFDGLPPGLWRLQLHPREAPAFLLTHEVVVTPGMPSVVTVIFPDDAPPLPK